MFSRFDRPLGVAWFDNTDQILFGHACIHGGEVFEINTTGDLSNDVVWWTNISRPQDLKSGTIESPRLRNEYFLRTRLQSVRQELGLKLSEPEFALPKLSQTFDQVLQMSSLYAGITSPPDLSLAAGFRQVFMGEDEAITHSVQAASKEAIQTHVRCQLRKDIESDNFELLPLYFYRPEYAKKILSFPLPNDEWKLARADEVPLSSEDKLKWVIERHKSAPSIVEVTVKKTDPRVNHLINYGAGAGVESLQHGKSSYTTPINRAWITSLELEVLSEFCEFEAHQVLLGTGFRTPSISIPNWGDYAKLSYSYGLLCENIWVSLTKNRLGYGAKTPLAAWVHAADRMECLKKAMQLEAEEDASIFSYGYGRLLLRVPTGETETLSNMALRQNMVTSAPDTARERQLPKQPSVAQLMQVTLERRAYDFLGERDDDTIKYAVALQQERERQATQHTSLDL